MIRWSYWRQCRVPIPSEHSRAFCTELPFHRFQGWHPRPGLEAASLQEKSKSNYAIKVQSFGSSLEIEMSVTSVTNISPHLGGCKFPLKSCAIKIIYNNSGETEEVW